MDIKAKITQLENRKKIKEIKIENKELQIEKLHELIDGYDLEIDTLLRKIGK